ncbi:PspC domain-containing protein [Pseudoxanthomonas suwonensis]|jgi:Putative stress-responsive transcriptional regulator|uniref:PspC domain-containing protein n=1 Tax=Pseudoxanthomonas suwonensis TaxID=314722 RepID=UPI0004ADBA0B|nr:PspC domain-containing protein [Pseudoxanthomonas suwonensis]
MIDCAADRWNLADLRKSARDMWLAGICGGLGEHTPVPAWIWRALFLAAAIWGGGGLLLYLVLWLLMPAGRLEPDVPATHGGEGLPTR